jgi:hypothetical protein
MQKAEEDVPRRSDHNPRVPRPHHQIPRLRLRHSLKSCNPLIEIVRARIGIRKARPLVNRMHQMRAVVLRIARRLCIERGSNHRQPIVRTQPPHARPSPDLRLRNIKRQRTEPNRNRDFPPIPHSPIVMQIPPPAPVTVVHGTRSAKPMWGGHSCPPPLKLFLIQGAPPPPRDFHSAHMFIQP